MVSVHRKVRIALLSLAVLGPCVTGGCSRKIPIYQIPAFYTKDLRSIAVQPFRSASHRQGVGDTIASQLAAALAHNGTYRVYNRQDLKALMDEHDLRLLLGGSDASRSASALRKLGKVDALLIGTVSSYAVNTNRQRITEPEKYWDSRQKRWVVLGYKSYVKTRHDAVVEVTASLIDVRTGRPIGSTNPSARAIDNSEGSPPRKSAAQCLATARGNVIGDLVATFAIVRKVISVNPKKVLKIASKRVAGKWVEPKTLSASAEEMFIVVDLPAVCDRNYFRYEILRKNGDTVLAGEKFLWRRMDSGQGGRPFAFSPRGLFVKQGAGDYTVLFYSGLKAEPVFTRDLKIVE